MVGNHHFHPFINGWPWGTRLNLVLTKNTFNKLHQELLDDLPGSKKWKNPGRFCFFCGFHKNPSRNSTAFLSKASVSVSKKTPTTPGKGCRKPAHQTHVRHFYQGVIYFRVQPKLHGHFSGELGGGMPKNCIDSGWIFPTRKWVVESNDPPVLEKKTAGQPGCHGKTLVLGSGKT